MDPIIKSLSHGLIVSCQALSDEPLYGSAYMAAMARAALMGGAVGIRANTPVDIAAIHQEVKLPIIGLFKQTVPGCDVYITPTSAAAKEVALAGADIIALDATLRPHPESKSAADLIAEVKQQTGKLVLADIDTVYAGVAAAKAGADAVSTTLSGYTADSPKSAEPDFDLIQHLANCLEIPVIAEGRFWTVEQVNQAFDLGAYAVVIGGAITRPQQITRRFVDHIHSHLGEENL
ncbi:putative N-acetylmannosamine-6-phosphate 2-epimerase [bioreactor metagenome]|uniref:N-acylglucosamine-6-phosphate 2-epimerase n=1 Tax=bioreactor metagenome TaxID=1076179 RepID=A0A645CJ63_9ZZZZ